MTQQSQVEIINQEINRELSNESVGKALLATTFKGLTQVSMKQALMEGMIRGFSFKDFMLKNIYAIPFSGGYSLITSIDYARKIGMRSGIVGKDKPVYTEKDGKIETCAVTVKKKIGDYIGDFTSEVYFSEYDKGANLWKTKPRTMIAKVAEMHALRMACPEELSQSYIEEEIDPEQSRKIIKVEGSELRMGNFSQDGKNKKEEKVEDHDQQDAAGSDTEPVIE